MPEELKKAAEAAEKKYDKLLSQQYASSRILNAIIHGGLAGTGAFLAFEIAAAIGVEPRILASPVVRAFAVVSYAVLTAGCAAILLVGSRQAPRNQKVSLSYKPVVEVLDRMYSVLVTIPVLRPFVF